MRRFPWTTRKIDVHRERLLISRLRVIVGEVIDHLLDADCIFWRERAFIDKPPNVRIRRRVYID